MHIIRFLTTLPLRLRSVFRRRRVEQELDEEIKYHLDRQMEEFIAKGLTPEEARYATLQRFRAVEQRKEECRDVRNLSSIEHVGRDIRYAARGLIKNPGFTCAAVL